MFGPHLFHQGKKQRNGETILIYNDVTAIKVILFILLILIFTYFLLFGGGVEIVLFLVRLSFFVVDGTPIFLWLK